MRYVIQLSTGSFDKTTVKAEDVIRKLEDCCQLLNTEKLIFGWALDQDLNKEICGFAQAHRIESYLWLPVFAEIQDFQRTRANQGIMPDKKRCFRTDGGDAFEFACQSDSTAISRAEEIYNEMTAGCQVDGVFLDRIRYASASVSPGAVYGCWCSQCRGIYESYGVDIEQIENSVREKELEGFLPDRREGLIYRFADFNIDRLAEAKRNIISRQVGQLCSIFREKGLKIGIDTFAPAIADFVGQDLVVLGKMADFVKPMVYLRTDAPAGIPFELKGLGGAMKRRLDELWGGEVDQISSAVSQIAVLKEMGIQVTPGIDANEIPNICSADDSYVKTFLKELETVGCGTAVLSWDIMRISSEMIEKLAAFI